MKNSLKSTKLSKRNEKLKEFVLEVCDKNNTFKMELIEALTQDCPFEEACGESYMQSQGESYYDGREDAYD